MAMMEDVYRCVQCGGEGDRAAGRPSFEVSTSFWTCTNPQCKATFPTHNGIPSLVQSSLVAKSDEELMSKYYNGFLGKWYMSVMPWMGLAFRPNYWSGWLAYGAVVGALAGLGVGVYQGSPRTQAGCGTVLAAVASFCGSHPYMLWLIALAPVTKLSLSSRSFTPKPKEGFRETHQEILAELRAKGPGLRVLDTSTGTCNSLIGHGWLGLDHATFFASDLSHTMLTLGLQNVQKSTSKAVHACLGDCLRLPYKTGTFDVVTNYGALNSFSDPGKGLAELTRVLKVGGQLLILDEELYPEATFVEKLYFHKVLASHDNIHAFPRTSLPPNLSEVFIRQTYHFYYLFTARKTLPDIQDGKLIINTKLVNGKLEMEYDVALVRDALNAGVILVLKGCFKPEWCHELRKNTLAWRTATPMLEHHSSKEAVIKAKTCWHRLDSERNASSIPHLFHIHTFDSVGSLPDPMQTSLRRMAEPMCALQAQLGAYDKPYELYPGERKLDATFRPQIIQYPAGGGFFDKHTHEIDPQRCGFVCSLSDDHKMQGGTTFETPFGHVDTAKDHEIGDIVVFRYDLPHAVSMVDPDRPELGWSCKGSSGRWTLVSPLKWNTAM